MIERPTGTGLFEFAVVASLRATQLSRGCRPRVARHHTIATTAQHEVAEGKVTRMGDVDASSDQDDA